MGKNSKRRKSYYLNFAKRRKILKNVLAPNMVGFLCTCNDREKECVKEAYHILNQFADELYGKEGEAVTTIDDEQEITVPGGDVDVKNKSLECEKNENEASADDDEEDIEAAVKAEATILKEDMKRRFQQVRCYANNCVFISTKLHDPVEISLAIMSSIIETQKQITKRLLRLIPVQSTCKAHTEDIIRCGKALCKTFFSDKEMSHYILFKSRSNSSIKRDPIVQGLSRAILEASPNSKADCKTPEIVLCIEVIKDVCCFGFLPNYFNKYCKYNLVELALRQGKDKVQDALGQEGDDRNRTSSDLTQQIPVEVLSESLDLQNVAEERTQEGCLT